MSAQAVRTWFRKRTSRLYANTIHTAMTARIRTKMVTLDSPIASAWCAMPLLFRQHFAEQLTRIEAQCTRQFGELDDVDAAFAAFDLRDVRMRALQPLCQSSLRQ